MQECARSGAQGAQGWRKGGEPFSVGGSFVLLSFFPSFLVPDGPPILPERYSIKGKGKGGGEAERSDPGEEHAGRLQGFASHSMQDAAAACALAHPHSTTRAKRPPTDPPLPAWDVAWADGEGKLWLVAGRKAERDEDGKA